VKGHLDFETRSAVDIKKVGGWAYALHPSTDIMCATWRMPGGPRVLFRREDILAGRYPEQAMEGVLVSAHNAAFERMIWNIVGHRRYGWPLRWAPELWRCTMAKAAACGLPLDLDNLGRVLQIKTPKDLEGRALMLKLARPLSDDPLFGPVFDEDPAKYERLYLYNAVDVDAEMEVDEMLPDLDANEQRVFELDMIVNQRGIRLDVPFTRAAARLAAAVIGPLNERLHGLTCRTPKPCTVKTCDGVDKATRVAALKEYIDRRFGIVVPSLDKEGVTKLLLDPAVPAEAKEVLTIRRQVGKKNSVAKYQAALDCLSHGDRVRGLLQYHGAHTGRWAGRLLQPQNMPKGFDKPATQVAVVSDVMGMTPEQFVTKYGALAMDTLSEALRAMFVPSEGKVIVCGDFNAIEARGLFWLAGEVAALNAYRRGESPYLDMAASIYKREDLSKHGTPVEYDIGKRTVLGCGYQMGADRFRSNVYSETAKKGKPVDIPMELAKRAVAAYREKYPKVKALWYEVERAAVNAVREPGKIFWCAGARVGWSMSVDRRFLLCRLPSGRFLRYWKPSLVKATTPWGEDKDVLLYWGEDSKLGWVQLQTYGGALVENIVQAIARDLLAHGMLNAQAAGYDVLLTVHDEVVAEVDVRLAMDKAAVLTNFYAKLCAVPEWAAGYPVAAEGYIDTRYHK
jgi:DNA polymerase